MIAILHLKTSPVTDAFPQPNISVTSFRDWTSTWKDALERAPTEDDLLVSALIPWHTGLGSACSHI
jgi:hypothetical protein